MNTVTAVNSALSSSLSPRQPVITASPSEQPVTATIPSRQPVPAGHNATQGDKTNGLATHPERAPGHRPGSQAPPGSLPAARLPICVGSARWRSCYLCLENAFRAVPRSTYRALV